MNAFHFDGMLSLVLNQFFGRMTFSISCTTSLYLRSFSGVNISIIQVVHLQEEETMMRNLNLWPQMLWEEKEEKIIAI